MARAKAKKQEDTTTPSAPPTLEELMAVALKTGASFVDRLEAGDYEVMGFTLNTIASKTPIKIGGRKVQLIQLVCDLGHGAQWVKTYTPTSCATLMKHFRKSSNIAGKFYAVTFENNVLGMTESQIQSIPDVMEKGSDFNRKLNPKSITSDEYCYLSALTAIANDMVDTLGDLTGETVRVGGGLSTHIVVNADEDIEEVRF